MKNLLIASLLFQLICTSGLCAQEVLETKVLKEIQEYSSEYFVAKVSDILVKDQHIFFSDRGLMAIIKTDLELNFISKFGEKGMGPNEMESPQFLLDSDLTSNIYVIDTKLMKVLSYSQNGELVGSPFSFGLPIVNSPLAFNSRLYLTSPLNPLNEINTYDLASGKKIESITLKGEVSKSSLGRDLYFIKNQIVSIINYNPPAIEVFDKNWHLTNFFDFSENPLIDKRIKFKKTSGFKVSGSGKEQLKQTASGEIIIKCSRLYNNKLYLLISTMDGREDTITNTIFTYEFEHNNWVQKEQINLPKDGEYNTFAVVDDNKLVAFEWISSTLQLLETVR